MPSIAYHNLGAPPLPSFVPWLPLGPNGEVPVQAALWTTGNFWFGGPRNSVSDYFTAAGGTFTRTTDATYWDASGVLQTAGSGSLRLTHNPATGDPLGLWVEGQRTKIALHSNELDDGYWSRTNLTPTSAANSRFGTLWTLTDSNDGSNVAHGLGRGSSIFGNSDLRAASVVLKAGTRPRVRVGFQIISGQTADFCAIVDLSAGSIIATSNLTASSLTPLGDGFYLLRIAAAATATAAEQRLGIQIVPDNLTLATSGSGSNYQGNGTGTVLVAFLEAEAAGFPSSIAGTGASSVTRNAEALAFTRAGTPSGTVLVHFRTAPGKEGNQVLWHWDDGTSDERIRLVRASTGNVHFIVTVAGVDEVNLDLGNVADSTSARVAFSWTAGSYAASLNGGTPVTSSYAGSLPTVTTIRVGRSSSGNEAFATFARDVRWSQALSVQELAG